MRERPLDKEDDENILKRCIFVTDLKLYTRIEHIEDYFEAFGTVEKVTMVSRPDLTYTRSCIVKMKLEEEANEILKARKKHKIYLAIVNVCKYMGMNSHKHVYDHGEFRMTLKYPKRTGMSFQKYYEVIESACYNGYCSIQFIWDANDRFKGDVKIRFRTEKNREEAKNLMPIYVKKIAYTLKTPKRR